jgi:hypothetical protein
MINKLKENMKAMKKKMGNVNREIEILCKRRSK